MRSYLLLLLFGVASCNPETTTSSSSACGPETSDGCTEAAAGCRRWGVCHQICTDTQGSHECSCAPGYRKFLHRCWSSEPMATFVAHDEGLLRLETAEAGVLTYRNILQNTSFAALDFHYCKNYIVWADLTHNLVRLQKLSATGDGKDIFYKSWSLPKPWEPVALAVDWVADKLYIVDGLKLHIGVVDINTNIYGTIFGSCLTKPKDLALDPTAGLMFVADDNRILRANMDGTNISSIVSQDISETKKFSSIDVDIVTRRLYFSYYTKEHTTIETVDYSGSNKILVLKKSQPYQPFKISLFLDKVYWVSPSERVIKSISKFDGLPSVETVFEMDSSMGEPKAISVVNKLKQPYVDGLCKVNNGGCSQFCLLKTSPFGNLTYRCACKSGYTLLNETSCFRVSDFLIYSQNNIIKSKVLNRLMDDFTDAIHPVVYPEARFVGLDFDAHEKYIYYSDSTRNTICRVKSNGMMPEILFKLTKGSLENIALDWITKNIYFIDPLRGILGVVSTKYKIMKILFTDLRSPRAVVVHPNKGYVFYLELTVPPKITRIDTDGNNSLVFQSKMLDLPNGLAIDFNTERLYWSDANRHHVQHSKFDFSDIRTINSEMIKHPFSIVIHKEFMYTADWDLKAVVRMDKLSGESGVIVEQTPTRVFLGIKVYSIEVQDIVHLHPCLRNNGDCKELCFGVPKNGSDQLAVKCGCSGKKELALDSKSCSKVVKISDVENMASQWASNITKEVAESQTVLPPAACDKSTELKCDNMCVPKFWVCDGEDDCQDSSDERQNCPNHEDLVLLKKVISKITAQNEEYNSDT